MAGRTSEKGNTTGKTIFCFIGKVIGAGITAFAILALFCVFYYNPPVHEPCGNGVTSYVRQADTFWARGTEGLPWELPMTVVITTVIRRMEERLLF